jgi:acetyltransferase-like isoleucine patch superfamily enzyme
VSAYVHPSAKIGDNFKPAPFVLVDDDVVIGDNVILGPFVHVRHGAKIGDNVMIGDHVTIHDDAVIGEACVIADGAVVGKRPALSPRSTAKKEPLPGLVIGEACKIGSHVVLMAGSRFGDRVIVGDGAGVRERCEIGDDVVVGRAVTVENDTTIGARTKIQSGAYVTAYVTLEEDVFIAPMVVTTNDNYMGRTEKRFAELRGCTVRRGARVGGGSHILPGIEIGEEAFVATGSVVTRDVPARTLVMGVPAKPVREVPDDELVENQ